MITLPFAITDNHIADLSTAIAFWHGKAKGRFNIDNWAKPVFTVSSLKGACGGKADYNENKVLVNFQLYKENKTDYLWQVIGHEVAHLATGKIFGLARIRHNGHGNEWVSVMRGLGLSPDRCHSMDVSNVKQDRARNRYIYQCLCKRPLYLTLQKHKKSDTLICTTCRSKIRFTGQVQNINV